MSHDNHDNHEDEHYNFFETLTYTGGTAVFAVFWTVLAITFLILVLTLG